MIFNSLPFLIFILVFMPVYFYLRGRRRLLWCLAGSYFFYGWWDWRFLSLIAFSTLVDYFVGMKLEHEHRPRWRKRWLTVSVVVNLGVLAFFKYFNFFAESLRALLHTIGWEADWTTLNIILPVGISFYTFQSMSYTIDVYRRKIPVEHSLVRFATYIAFFPQLVAGPIVRAAELLPQFHHDHPFRWDNFVKGGTQALWGFFKKVAIADTLAPFVDQCFQSPDSFGAMHLLIGVIFYSFQIYCDFSGYSDIAIGLARMLGFRFPENFRSPYFSRSFSEFWTRWHITLSSWLRDYLYIPLGGNRHGTFKTYRNLMLTMLLGGLWHGASWVFVFWGFLHGMYLVGQRLLGPPFGKMLAALRVPRALQAGGYILLVYTLTNVAWVFFRSPDFGTAMAMFQGMADIASFSWELVINKFLVLKGALLIAFLLWVDVAALRLDWQELVWRKPQWQVAAWAVLLWLMAFFGTFDSNAFIYFQF